MSSPLVSALSILDYGCDEGPYDDEATAVRDVIEQLARCRDALAEIVDEAGKGWDGGYGDGIAAAASIAQKALVS